MCGNFTPFISTSLQIWAHFFPLLCPKDSESQKISYIQIWDVGANKHFNGTSKVKTRTNTHARIFWLIESIDPEGQCFENIHNSSHHYLRSKFSTSDERGVPFLFIFLKIVLNSGVTQFHTQFSHISSQFWTLNRKIKIV